MKKTFVSYLAILVVLLIQVGCASTSAKPTFSQPSLNERLEKAFNPPWWYKGPIRSVYNKLYPPPWYQGSLDWMGTEVNEICDAKTEAMVRAAGSATGGLVAPSNIAVIFGVVRVVGTAGIVTYCRLRD